MGQNDDFSLYSWRYKRSQKYEWDKILSKEQIDKNKWLAEIWIDLYTRFPDDEYIRKLSTDEMLNTNWYEQYGFKYKE